jgi:hypothetical protein
MEGEMGRARMTNRGEEEYTYRIMVGKPEGKRPLERPRRRWLDNIKIGWDEMGWYGLDRTGSGYGLVEGSCERGDELSGSINTGKFLSGCTIGSSVSK